MLQGGYRDALNRARQLGLTPENALDDYAKESYNAAVMGIRKDEFEANQQWKQDQAAYQKNKDALDQRQRETQNWFEQQRIDLAKQGAAKAKSPTVEQTNNKLYGTRVNAAVKTMRSVLPSLSTSDKMQIIASILSGSDLSMSQNAATYMNSLKDAIRATLRRESGASISSNETAGGYESYGFHRFGNDSITNTNLERLANVGKILMEGSGEQAPSEESAPAPVKTESKAPIVNPKNGKVVK